MKKKIGIIYSTNNGDDFIKKFNQELTISCGLNRNNVVIYPIINHNKYSLSKAYNMGFDFFDKNHNLNEFILIFIHHDIYFDTQKWGYKLLTHFNSPQNNYGILGVAGTTELNAHGCWWLDSEGATNKRMVGIVNHKDEFKKWTSEYSPPHVGTKPVVLIDGVIIIINPKEIEYKFDEEFNGFHFYDIDFCINNYLDGVNVGVITDIRITHMSIGKTNEEWEQNKIQFVDKYKHELPIIYREDIIIEEVNHILDRKPKISVIIPTKNNFSILKNNIESWILSVKYDDYEIIIADTGSDDKTKKQYLTLKNIINNLRVVEYDYWNFAKINNDVVKNHINNDTELLLFCNDDIELLNDAPSILVFQYLKNEEIAGTLGIRLHYYDNTCQHNGLFGYLNKNVLNVNHMSRQSNVYSISTNKKSFGNTGAFLMINKKLFQDIGGFNEDYVECLEDVELNMECLLRNKKNITASSAVAYHYESISRNKISDKTEREKEDSTRLRNFYKKNENEIKGYLLPVNTETGLPTLFVPPLKNKLYK